MKGHHLLAVPLSGAVLASSLCGCKGIAPKGGAGADAQPRAASAFPPRELRVHPLTAWVGVDADGGGAAVVHVELLDEWGDTVKALGTLRIELVFEEAGGASATRPEAMGDRGRQPLQWTIDLSRPDTNSRRFNTVTRTYRVRLRELPLWDESRRRAALNATFIGLDGDRLAGSMWLERSGEGS